jgi:hypothetical protein
MSRWIRATISPKRPSARLVASFRTSQTTGLRSCSSRQRTALTCKFTRHFSKHWLTDTLAAFLKSATEDPKASSSTKAVSTSTTSPAARQPPSRKGSACLSAQLQTPTTAKSSSPTSATDAGPPHPRAHLSVALPALEVTLSPSPRTPSANLSASPSFSLRKPLDPHFSISTNMTLSCWNGKDLDSPDHQSHVSYGQGAGANGGGACPSTHPVKLPQIMYELMWDVSKFADKSLWPTDGSDPFVYSMNLGGAAAHADYVFGWEGDSLQKAMDNGCNLNNACPKAGLTTQLPAAYNACKKKQQAPEDVDGCKFFLLLSFVGLMLMCVVQGSKKCRLVTNSSRHRCYFACLHARMIVLLGDRGFSCSLSSVVGSFLHTNSGPPFMKFVIRSHVAYSLRSL